jgi:hypothetical protein
VTKDEAKTDEKKGTHSGETGLAVIADKGRNSPFIRAAIGFSLTFSGQESFFLKPGCRSH